MLKRIRKWVNGLKPTWKFLLPKKRRRAKKGENLRTVLAIFADAQEPLSVPEIIAASCKRGSPIPPSSVRSVLNQYPDHFGLRQDGGKWQLTEAAAKRMME